MVPTFQLVLVVKNLPASAGDVRDSCLIPQSGRSFEGRNGNLLQYSCLENPMDGGAWRTEEPGGQRSTGSQRLVLKRLSMHVIPNKFRIICFSSMKNDIGILIWITLNL